MSRTITFSWKPVSELPFEDNLCRKVLMLSEGRLDSSRMYVISDYWKVYVTDHDYDVIESNIIKKQVDQQKFAYGSFSRGVPVKKIIGWTFEDELIPPINDKKSGGNIF